MIHDLLLGVAAYLVLVMLPVLAICAVIGAASKRGERAAARAYAMAIHPAGGRHRHLTVVHGGKAGA